MTRPQKGTAEHRAWVIAAIVEAARRAGREPHRMPRDRVAAVRTSRDVHWPQNDDYAALGGYTAARHAAAEARPSLAPPVVSHVHLFDRPPVLPAAEGPDFSERGPDFAFERPDPVADLIERDREAERRDERARLLREIADLRAEVAHVRAVASDAPPPSVQPRERAYGLREAAMLACASDWHLEEYVDPAKIGHVNAYDLSIAEASARRFFDALVWLYDHHSTHFALRDLVLWLGGDLIGGYIHDELVETNQLAPLPATRFAREVIGAGIRMLLAETNLARVLVPCSYGNHGRTTVKSRISSGAENSYENHLYHSLAADFRDEPRVEFVIASGPLLYVDVLGTMVRFTHGDAVKYGGGVGGISIPINKSIAGWDTTIRADLTVMGHWHQYLSGQRALVNGSLIGHGPFSDWIKAQHEVPRQAFCLIDSRRGPCMHTPIWVRPDSPRHVLDPVRSDEIRRRVLGTRESEAA